MSEKNISIKQSGSISLKALTWLRDYHLPTDPICYHVAYTLFDKPNPDLKTRVAMLNKNSEHIKDDIYQIYNDYIISDHDFELNEFTKKVGKLVKKTEMSIDDTKDSFKNYINNLETSKKKLKNKTNSVITVIALLLEETEIVNKKAQLLEKELEVASNSIKALQKEHLSHKSKALYDPLTDILNRSGLMAAYEEIEDIDSNYPISIVIGDIDCFSKFNAEHGHIVGDQILKLIASTLRKNLNYKDILSRFGGEEFLILLPKTDKIKAKDVVNNLRNKLDKIAVKKRGANAYLPKLTLSFGISEINSCLDFNSGIENADKALLKSKENGRNCVNFT
ncbi:MAG: GGDEF domain-containing protein [Gammaproteobacteria bacterium]|nr:GGDEF domain-containing protein [Gammaproteobacteria bacterium]MDH5631309.1 GGDEF domain-containing protein [Gammaproteobacteria bacterium]